MIFINSGRKKLSITQVQLVNNYWNGSDLLIVSYMFDEKCMQASSTIMRYNTISDEIYTMVTIIYKILLPTPGKKVHVVHVINYTTSTLLITLLTRRDFAFPDTMHIYRHNYEELIYAMSLLFYPGDIEAVSYITIITRLSI